MPSTGPSTLTAVASISELVASAAITLTEE
jgi:hypothetical protein